MVTASIIRGLVYKWGLIDHVNNAQGIVTWKEDVKNYNDGIIRWKDYWPGTDEQGNRLWLSEEDFKKRGAEMRNEYAAIVALSFYNSMIRDNERLRQACSYRYFLNDSIDAWKIEPIEAGDPPRNAARSSIIFQLQTQWGVITSFDLERVDWKQDDKECDADKRILFDDLLAASLDI